LSRNGRKGVCPDIFKKLFEEFGRVVRIITDFFAQCKKKPPEAPMEELRFSGIERS
jgi:hypothetical protein